MQQREERTSMPLKDTINKRKELQQELGTRMLNLEKLKEQTYPNYSALDAKDIADLANLRRSLDMEVDSAEREIIALNNKLELESLSDAKPDTRAIEEEVATGMAILQSLSSDINIIYDRMTEQIGGVDIANISIKNSRSRNITLDEVISAIPRYSKQYDRIEDYLTETMSSKVCTHIDQKVFQVLIDKFADIALQVRAVVYLALLALALVLPQLIVPLALAFLAVNFISTTQNYEHMFIIYSELTDIRVFISNQENERQEELEERKQKALEELRREKDKRLDAIAEQIRKKSDALQKTVDDNEDMIEETKKKLKERQVVQRQDIDAKCEIAKESVLREEEIIETIRMQIKELNDSIPMLQEEALTIFGLSPNAERVSILDPIMASGFTEEGDITTLNISTPTYFITPPNSDAIDYISHLLISQVLGRMLATKIFIHIYTPYTGGSKYIKYLNRDFSEYGVNIINNESKFQELLTQFESEASTLLYEIDGFPNITEFNRKMLESNSITKPYNIIIFENLPSNISKIRSLPSSYGYHWISLETPIDNRKLANFSEVFTNKVLID